jgi:hypothetical protein
MHIRAIKPSQWSGAMAIDHDQFDISAIQSHGQHTSSSRKHQGMVQVMKQQ